MPNETNDPPVPRGVPSPEERPDLYDDDDSMRVAAGARSQVAIPERLAARIEAKTGAPYGGRVVGRSNSVVAEVPAGPPSADPIGEALAMREAGDLPGAIRFLYGELAHDLSGVRVVTTLATMLAENGEFDRAERVFQRAFAAGIKNQALELNYATFLAHSGRSETAAFGLRELGEKIAARLPELSSDDPALATLVDQWAVADCNLARLRMLEGNQDAARDLAEKWLTSRKHWRAAHNVVAQCISDEAAPKVYRQLMHARRASPAMLCLLEDWEDSDDGTMVIWMAGDRAFKWDWKADGREYLA